jgi:hypothetical protein
VKLTTRSSSSSVEVKNEWRCTSASPYAFLSYTRKTLIYSLALDSDTKTGTNVEMKVKISFTFIPFGSTELAQQRVSPKPPIKQF